MSFTDEDFPLDRFNASAYDFRDSRSIGLIEDLAENFVDYLRDGRPPESVKIKIDRFVNLIVANNDPEHSVDLFKIISLQVPELRLPRNITTHKNPAIAYLLLQTQSYRPPAPLREIAPETLQFTQSVTRQLEMYEQTLRNSSKDEEISRALLNAILGQSGVSMPSGSDAVLRQSSLGSPPVPHQTAMTRSISLTNMPTPGFESPESRQSQIQQKGHHSRVPSGSGTSGRREESESGSIQALRNRRPSHTSQASSPPSLDAAVARSMGDLSIKPSFYQGPQAGSPSMPWGMTGVVNVPREGINPISPSQLADLPRRGPGHADAQGTRSPSQTRSRAGSGSSNTYGSSSFAPSAYDNQRRAPSRGRNPSPQPQVSQGQFQRGHSSSFSGSSSGPPPRTPSQQGRTTGGQRDDVHGRGSSARPPPSAFRSPPQLTPHDRGRSGSRQSEQPRVRDTSTGATGGVHRGPSPQSVTQDVDTRRGRSISRQSGPPGNTGVGTTRPPSSFRQPAQPTEPVSRTPSVQPDRGRAQTRPSAADPRGASSTNRAPSNAPQGAPSGGRASSNAPQGNTFTQRAPSNASRGRGSGGRAPSNAPQRGVSQSKDSKQQQSISGFFKKQ